MPYRYCSSLQALNVEPELVVVGWQQWHGRYVARLCVKTYLYSSRTKKTELKNNG